MTELIFKYKGICEKQEVKPIESDVYKIIGQKMQELSTDIPLDLEVELTGLGKAHYSLTKRGTFVKDGIKRPSMYVVENHNDITGLEPSDYADAYLTCINPESNNYKFYHLKPDTMKTAPGISRL